MPDDVLERLERVEVQHADYIRVLSSPLRPLGPTLAPWRTFSKSSGNYSPRLL
jgi:hypothetical protein